MRILFFISILLILALGALTSYSDIKYKKAFNKQVFIFLVAGVGVQICCMILDVSVWYSTILNCGLTILLSILFYALRIWAAGDSKLFIAMILLIPYPLYMVENGIFFPAFFVLEFIFTLAVAYILIESIILLCLECTEKKSMHLKRFLPDFSRESIVSWITAFLLTDTCDVLLFSYGNKVLIENTYLFIVINILLVITVLSTFSSINTKISISCTLIAIRIVLSLRLGIVFSKISIWTIVIVTITMIIRNFTSQYNYRTIPVSKLEVGDVLAKSSVIFMIPSAVKGLPKFTDETTRCRLNEKEVDAVKRWEHSKYGKSTVTIVRTVPFAPFILGGTLLYFVYQIILGA